MLFRSFSIIGVSFIFTGAVSLISKVSHSLTLVIDQIFSVGISGKEAFTAVALLLLGKLICGSDGETEFTEYIPQENEIISIEISNGSVNYCIYDIDEVITIIRTIPANCIFKILFKFIIMKFRN